MTLKINVIYKGIIYRIKGIKVLCSVVLAVMILLVAILTMGAWMLANVHDNAGQINSSSNIGSITSQSSNISYVKGIFGYTTTLPPNFPPASIDLKNIPSSDYSFDAPTTQGNFIVKKEVKISEKKSIRPPAPEPNIAIFSGIDALNQDRSVAITLPVRNIELISKEISTKPIQEKPYISQEKNIFESVVGFDHPLNPWEPHIDEIVEVPPHLTPKNFSKVDPSHKKTKNESVDYPVFHNIHYFKIEDNESKNMRPRRRNDDIKTNEDKLKPIVSTRIPTPVVSTRIPTKTSTQLLHRSGIPSDKGSLTYDGPPVVGYGPHPYKTFSRKKLDKYFNFWKTYSNLERHEDIPVGVQMRPHLRGLRPSVEKYDLPLREDAQVPSRDPNVRKRPFLKYRPRRPRPPLPPSLRRNRPPFMMRRPAPDRRILKDEPLNDNLSPVEKEKPTSRPTIPLLGPLQEMYDYSKRLAASLLSFNTKSEGQIRNTSEKLAQHGISLIEDYIQVFSKKGGPLARISALIPTPERLRSLDTFELSLVTWTFLDFWEFLIEKVGTLSDEDLQLLQKRLDKLRKRKDSVMTQTLVNETMTKMASVSPRSLFDQLSINITGLNELYKDSEKRFKDDIFFKEININDGNISLVPENFLKNLFPNVTFNTTFNDQTINDKNEPNDRNKYSIKIIPFNSSKLTTKRLSEETTTSNLPEIKSPKQINNRESGQNLSTWEGPKQINNRESGQNLSTWEGPKQINNRKSGQNLSTWEGPKQINNRESGQNLSTWEGPKQINNRESGQNLSTWEGRSWDPLKLFSSDSRIQFMQFAVKVVFNFGKVYLQKAYALDCLLLLFCKDLNHDTTKGGLEGMAAKVKSVGLKVLTESDQELRNGDALGDVWRSLTSWQPLQCDVMFPRCDGPKALEIVNEVALGTN